LPVSRITVDLPFLPLFTLAQCSNCKAYGLESRLRTQLDLPGWYCRSCFKDLTRVIQPHEMAFEDDHHAESIDPGRETSGRAQLRGTHREPFTIIEDEIGSAASSSIGSGTGPGSDGQGPDGRLPATVLHILWASRARELARRFAKHKWSRSTRPDR